MKVFISWKGKRSHAVADGLRIFLPDIIQAVEPWFSNSDIHSGARGEVELAQALAEMKFGILVLTKANAQAPWINFEAGALAKTLRDAFVVPYLLDLTEKEVPEGPLSWR